MARRISLRPLLLAALACVGGAAGARAQENGITSLLRGTKAPGVTSGETTGALPAGDAAGKSTADRRKASASATRDAVRGSTTQPVQVDVTQSVTAPVAALPPPLPDPPPLRRRRAEEDPYAPLGIRAGGITYFPSVEESLGYDTNPNRLGGAHKGSSVSKTEGALQFQSDWSSHELKGVLRGAYLAYPSVSDANRPDASGQIGLRLDVLRDTKIDLETRFGVTTERPGSVDLPTSVVNRPIDFGVGASAGVTQSFNRLSVGLKGSVDHYSYEDAKLQNGSTFDQSDRDYAQYGLALRGSYELTPGVKPFLEAQIDTRHHDQSIDSSGFARDSNGLTGRIGTTLELTRLVTGEISAGYQKRTYDDVRLRDLRGPVVDAALVWSASPLTTVRLKAGTTLDETTAIGSSGTVTRSATLEIEHALRRNITLIGSAGFSHANYRGINIEEDGFTGSIKADYKLTRSLVLRTSFTHERLNSSVPGADYTANVYLIGLRLQR